MFLRLNTTDPSYQEVICTMKNSETYDDNYGKLTHWLEQFMVIT
jgi:hypothetical protein